MSRPTQRRRSRASALTQCARLASVAWPPSQTSDWDDQRSSVLLGRRVRGGQSERAALGVSAYGPPIAGVDDGAAELADAVERCGQLGDGEVWKGSGVAGAGSALVDSEAQVVGL